MFNAFVKKNKEFLDSRSRVRHIVDEIDSRFAGDINDYLESKRQTDYDGAKNDLFTIFEYVVRSDEAVNELACMIRTLDKEEKKDVSRN